MPVSGAATARLRWAIRPSFIEYVQALEDGIIEGVRDVYGNFVFDADGDEGGILRFRNAVVLRGHEGALALTIADPWIAHDGHSGNLAVRSADGARVELARLGVMTRSGHRLRIDDVALTLAGTDLFDGHYRPHTRLAPVEIDLD